MGRRESKSQAIPLKGSRICLNAKPAYRHCCRNGDFFTQHCPMLRAISQSWAI
jgi:hypothetical protein